MTFIHLITLALVQGITEFLPVSSSGHLVLVPIFLSKQDHGLMLDVAAHGGSLLAVMGYFYRDVVQIFQGGLDTILRRQSPQRFLFLSILIATIPGLVIGGLLHFYASNLFRHAGVIAATSAGFGVLLWWVDRQAPSQKTLMRMTLKSAFLIGCAQILAFIPGTSRSGITMTMARYFGFDRDSAARFSMFLSMPIIGAAVLIYVLEGVRRGSDIILSADFFIVLGLSFLASILSIHWLLIWLKKRSFAVFALYRLALSGLIILLVL